MKVTESVRISWRAITGHKLRSSLTTLGIVIGVGSVIVFMVLGGGFEQNIINDIDDEDDPGMRVSTQQSAGFGVQLLDPLAAIVVGIAILYTGVEVTRDNLAYLVGAAPPEELRTEILRRAFAHPEVEGAHDVVAHYVGPEIDVSLHIEVQGDRTLLEAHEIETEVMASIRELPAVDDVFVHVDPREAGEWKQDENVDHLVNSFDGSEERQVGPEADDPTRGSPPDES